MSIDGAQGGSRTHTGCNPQRFLGPACVSPAFPFDYHFTPYFGRSKVGHCRHVQSFTTYADEGGGELRIELYNLVVVQ